MEKHWLLKQKKRLKNRQNLIYPFNQNHIHSNQVFLEKKGGQKQTKKTEKTLNQFVQSFQWMPFGLLEEDDGLMYIDKCPSNKKNSNEQIYVDFWWKMWIKSQTSNIFQANERWRSHILILIVDKKVILYLKYEYIKIG